MRLPRLMQPLFAREHGELYNAAAADRLLFRLVTAYDSLWNLRYQPDDICQADRLANAEATLQNLGQILENALGDAVFDADPRQLSFPDEILNPVTKPALCGEGEVP